MIGELLGPGALMARLAAHGEGAAARHGLRSVAAQQAVDTALYAADSASSLYAYSEHGRGEPPPDWLDGEEWGWRGRGGGQAGSPCLLCQCSVSVGPVPLPPHRPAFTSLF